MPFLVLHIDDVDGLLVGGGGPHMGQGLGHAHVRQHGHIVRGGHRTHAAFGIGGQTQDVFTFAVGQGGQQALAGGFVQIVEQVHAFVGGHAFEQVHHGLAG